MHSVNENKDVGSFIQRSIHSFTALDIVLHYARQPNAQETPKSISKLLGKSHDESHQRWCHPAQYSAER